jgi:hypothetical protein
MKFYLCGAVMFYGSMTSCAFWILTDIGDDQLFYIILFFTVMVSGLCLSYYHRLYDRYTKITAESFNTDFARFDFFLEEFYRLTIESQKDQKQKFILFDHLVYHK